MKNKKTKIIYLSLAALFIFIPLKIAFANSISAANSEYCKHDPMLKECNWFPGECPQDPVKWENVESPIGISSFPAAPSGEKELLGCVTMGPKKDDYSKYSFENSFDPLEACKKNVDPNANSVKQISGPEYPNYCFYPIGESSSGNIIACANHTIPDNFMLFECLKSESAVPYRFCCPPPSCEISASPNSITSGQSSILTWSSKAGNSVTPFGFTASALSGNTSVNPSATTTYKLIVQNSNGKQATCETTINVKEPPAPLPVISGPCHDLVPCKDNCKLSDIFVMIQNIVNCLVFISTIICLLFLVIGGLLYIFSLGNPENLTKAKNTIIWALGGLALVFLAWLIVNTVMQFMGVGGGFLMWSRVG